MTNEGYMVSAEDHENLDKIKKFYGITPAYRSCHTAVSSNGYVFEGHIPSKYIEKFLKDGKNSKCHWAISPWDAIRFTRHGIWGQKNDV